MLFSSPYGLFVNTNNTIYVSDVGSNSIQVWNAKQSAPIKLMPGYIDNPVSVFVTANGDVYAGNGNNRQLHKWLPNATEGVSVMSVYEICFGLFITPNDQLYCSINEQHHVVSMPLGDTRNTLTLVAGKSCGGSTADMLYYPCGIVLDFTFNLYVADRDNDRVQRFTPGQTNATTVAGSGMSGTIILNRPISVALDEDGHLFIVDRDNHRILGSDANGFRCVAGCFSSSGAGPGYLNKPQTMAFDSFGNIWVTDQNNNRVQKFVLAVTSCGKKTFPAYDSIMHFLK